MSQMSLYMICELINKLNLRLFLLPMLLQFDIVKQENVTDCK